MVNSLIGIPVLFLFLGSTLLHVILILSINIASIAVIIYIKNTKIIGYFSITFGCLTLVSILYFGIPSFILFTIAGLLAIKEKQDKKILQFYDLKKDIKRKIEKIEQLNYQEYQELLHKLNTLYKNSQIDDHK